MSITPMSARGNRRAAPVPRFIYDLPFREHKEIEELLNLNDSWETLAGDHLNFTLTEVDKLRRYNQKPDQSAAKALLTFLEQKNTKILDLYLYLHKIQLYRGMDILKKYVPVKHHALILSGPMLIPPQPSQPASQPPEGNHQKYSLPQKIAPDYYDAPEETRSHNLTSGQSQNQAAALPSIPHNGPQYQYQPQLPGSHNSSTANIPSIQAPQQQQFATASHLSQSPQLQHHHRHLQQQQQIPTASSFSRSPQLVRQGLNNSQLNPPNHGNLFSVSPNTQPTLLSYYNEASRQSQLPQQIMLNKHQSVSIQDYLPLRQRNFSECTNISTASSNVHGGVPCVTIANLAVACDNWAGGNRIGEGGYGEVYRGLWQHQVVAIKRIRRDKSQSPDDAQYQKCIDQCFQEIMFLNKLRSAFIVPILAYSESPDPCIVYQYMPNGSLADSKNGTAALTWLQRYQIALGTANGLQFLHSTTKGEKKLIHGDIKSANILLDKNMDPKIGDFGLAREVESDQSKIVLTTIYGTKFYLPNDFFRDRQLSTKVDTYSYGVILFDLVTGRPPNYKDKVTNSYLVDLMKEENEIGRWVDKSWPEFLTDIQISAILYHFGQQCARERKRDRPEMEEVFVKLRACLRKESVGSPSPLELQLRYDSSLGDQKQAQPPLQQQQQQQHLQQQKSSSDEGSTVVLSGLDLNKEEDLHQFLSGKIETLPEVGGRKPAAKLTYPVPQPTTAASSSFSLVHTATTNPTNGGAVVPVTILASQPTSLLDRSLSQRQEDYPTLLPTVPCGAAENLAPNLSALLPTVSGGATENLAPNLSALLPTTVEEPPLPDLSQLLVGGGGGSGGGGQHTETEGLTTGTAVMPLLSGLMPGSEEWNMNSSSSQHLSSTDSRLEQIDSIVSNADDLLKDFF